MNNKLLIVAILVVLAGVGLYWYNSYQKPAEEMPIDMGSAEKEPVAVAPVVSGPKVDIVKFVFAPLTLTVKKGEKVTFTNLDAAPHTVTSPHFGGQHILNKNQSYVLDTSTLDHGSYQYICDFHPSMKAGTLIITP